MNSHDWQPWLNDQGSHPFLRWGPRGSENLRNSSPTAEAPFRLLISSHYLVGGPGCWTRSTACGARGREARRGRPLSALRWHSGPASGRTGAPPREGGKPGAGCCCPPTYLKVLTCMLHIWGCWAVPSEGPEYHLWVSGASSWASLRSRRWGWGAHFGEKGGGQGAGEG